MITAEVFPDDFSRCVAFHGHVCPGLAIGFAAVNAARTMLGSAHAQDEELVVIVENDSCAVDAIQVLTGCTFGKGNLIFRDWGKQVFTLMDRKTGRAVRVSLRNRALPGHEERRALKAKIDAGDASQEDKEKWDKLRREAVSALVRGEPADFFEVREIALEMPPYASVVATKPCAKCGEPTMMSRLVETEQGPVCQECAQVGASR
ncbi:MAG: FmdE family protein [Thermodesulfobacteriota bacterium]